MVGKFVAYCHADAVGLAIRSNQVNACYLSLLSTIFGIRRNVERFSMCTQRTARAFVKPLWGNPDASIGRASAFDSPTEHLHTVGQIFRRSRMHGLASACAAEVSQSGTGNQATRRLVGMVNRR